MVICDAPQKAPCPMGLAACTSPRAGQQQMKPSLHLFPSRTAQGHSVPARLQHGCAAPRQPCMAAPHGV